MLESLLFNKLKRQGFIQGDLVPFIDTGIFYFTIPQNTYYISVAGVSGGGSGGRGNVGDGGGGGGAGGALAFANRVPVTPGQVIVIEVGRGGYVNVSLGRVADSGRKTSITIGSFVIEAPGAPGGAPYSARPGSVSMPPVFTNTPEGVQTGGAAGGNGGAAYNGGGGGGGAGGFTGLGGNGSGTFSAAGTNSQWPPGTDGVGEGSGGGGGAKYPATLGKSGGADGGLGQADKTGGGGGGANIFGAAYPATKGANGNGLNSAGSRGGDGGWPGGGGGGSYDNGTGFISLGGDGAVAILLGGSDVFPDVLL